MKIFNINHKKPASAEKPVMFPSLSNQSGVALIVALMLMLVMITMVPAALQLTSAEFDRAENFKDDREALFLAEAGLEQAKFLVKNNSSRDIFDGPDDTFSATSGSGASLNHLGTGTEIDDNGTLTAGGSAPSITGSTSSVWPSTIDGNNYTFTEVSYNGGTYYVRIFDNDDAALCNGACSTSNFDPTFDSDLEQWMDRDGVVEIEAVGVTADGTTASIHAQTKRKLLPAHNIPASVVLIGPKATLSSSSATYNVTGAGAVGGGGWDIGGAVDGECTGKGGVAVNAVDNGVPPGYDDTLTNPADIPACESPPGPPGTYDDFCFAMPNTAKKNIEGTNSDGGTNPSPNPDVSINNTTFDGDDAARLYEDVITNGTTQVTLPNPAVPSDLAGNLGSITNPVVVHAPGDLNMAGGASMTGYGILVVDGDFNMAGSITWNGIVLIGACPTCTGDLLGSGTLNINGTTIIGNSSSDRSRSQFNGTANFRYSCEGIDIANGAFKDTFGVVTWRRVQ